MQRTVVPVRLLLLVLAILMVSCGADELPWVPVQDLDTEARNAEDLAISWRETLIDDQGTSGVLLRGAVVLTRGNLDGDGQPDILTAYRDSSYLRAAFSTADPAEKFLLSLAENEDVAGISDIAIGDINADGWADIIAITDTGLLYLQNPAQSKPGFRWQRIHPATAEGAWVSVHILDLNGDGKAEIVALRPPVVGELPSLFQLLPGDNPISGDGWTTQLLAKHEDASFVVPGDLDGDGDLDFFTGVGAVSGLVWFRNNSSEARVAFEPRTVSVEGFSGAIHSPLLADLDGDSRLDVAGALDTGMIVTIVQSATPGAAWSARTIGNLDPDGVAGLAAADIDGDGDMDLLAGSEGSGPRDADAEVEPAQVNLSAPAARIAWFESPGSGSGAWKRHDLFRRERGRFSAFIPFDADNDGDIDFLGVRSDSGSLDGLFLLQQLHSAEPVFRFDPARLRGESLALPLP